MEFMDIVLFIVNFLQSLLFWFIFFIACSWYTHGSFINHKIQFNWIELDSVLKIPLAENLRMLRNCLEQSFSFEINIFFWKYFKFKRFIFVSNESYLVQEYQSELSEWTAEEKEEKWQNCINDLRAECFIVIYCVEKAKKEKLIHFHWFGQNEIERFLYHNKSFGFWTWRNYNGFYPMELFICCFCWAHHLFSLLAHENSKRMEFHVNFENQNVGEMCRHMSH